MTWKLEVTSEWVGSGTLVDPYAPRLAQDYPAVSWSDVTGTPVPSLVPDPSLVNIVVECDEITKDAIEADPNYITWWTEEIIDG